MQLLVDGNGIILAFGTFSAVPAEPDLSVVDLDASQVDMLLQPGQKKLRSDGKIDLIPEPLPTPLTLPEAKQRAHMSIKVYATNLREHFIAPLSAGEAASWLRKEEEATRFLADRLENNAPFLREEALVRGVSVADLANKVLENAASLKFLELRLRVPAVAMMTRSTV